MAKKANKANIDQIKRIFGRGAAEIIGEDQLFAALTAGIPLKFKMGMDPTSPDLHLGHAVGLRILRKLQDLGHEIVVIIGDYTARIGDPSGRSKTRPPLDGNQIDANAKTYFSQVGKILDVKKLEIRKNSEWLSELSFADLIKLASYFTVARTLERDDFSKRYKEGTEIFLHELLYPLMQAYDSVAIGAMVEVGGTDQTFNMLAGRELQKKQELYEQSVVSVRLLVGLDGVKKMSKSLGNYIGLTEAPENMYGKVMSIPDTLIIDYFELATEISDEEIAKIKSELDNGANPRDIKMRLAREIVALYHPEGVAQKAEDAFVKTFQKKETPDRVPEIDLSGDKRNIVDALIEAGFADSKTNARQLIEQKGIKINGQITTDIKAQIKRGDLIQKGKRFFVRVSIG